MAESIQHQVSDLKQWEKRFANATQRKQTELDRLSRQPFEFEADAQHALSSLKKP
ncbi:MAG: hypothetical protein AAF821_11200 [Cyanobacteria bacterium P01_D01_bin.156]